MPTDSIDGTDEAEAVLADRRGIGVDYDGGMQRLSVEGIETFDVSCIAVGGDELARCLGRTGPAASGVIES